MIPAMGFGLVIGIVIGCWVGWEGSRGTAVSRRWQEFRDFTLIGAVTFPLLAWAVTGVIGIIRYLLTR